MVKSSVKTSAKKSTINSTKKVSNSITAPNCVGIVNTTKKLTLHSAPRWAMSTSSQAKGFMFERPANNAIIFVFSPPKKISLHMWFVFGEIDVLGLDENYTVVTFKEHFKPWAFWSSEIPVAYILELPSGTISLTKTHIGDKISLPVLLLK